MSKHGAETWIPVEDAKVGDAVAVINGGIADIVTATNASDGGILVKLTYEDGFSEIPRGNKVLLVRRAEPLETPPKPLSERALPPFVYVCARDLQAGDHVMECDYMYELVERVPPTSNKCPYGFAVKGHGPGATMISFEPHKVVRVLVNKPAPTNR